MRDYSKDIDVLYKKVEAILNRYGIQPSKFMIEAGANNPKAHKEILEVLATYIPTTVDRYGITMSNRKRLIAICDEHKEDEAYLSAREYSIGSIIKTYLTSFYGYYFTVDEDSNIKYTHSEEFQLPTSGKNVDDAKNIEYINNKIGRNVPDKEMELCLLILPSGKIYYAANDHLTLAQWLNINNVDLHHAIRFESTKCLGDFSFTSLHNYKFSTGSDTDELMPITYDQAEGLGYIYSAIKHGWVFLKPLHYELKKTTGFGFGKTEQFEDGGTAIKNLQKIHDYLPDFDLGEYIRELRMSNNVHQNLT